MPVHPQYVQKVARGRFMPFICILFSGFMLLQLATLYFIYRHASIDAVSTDIKAISKRVANSLRYHDGTWDTRLYTSDPQTPHPSGSSGYNQTLYIITADGFVIERSSPINGLLDTSDFKHLTAFQTAQTTSQVTNDRWRILSRPVVRNNTTKGVIMTAYYNPNDADIESIDGKLLKTIEAIDKGITVSGRDIAVNSIDVRTLDYDVSFEVVNSFNKVLLNNGRMPTYIDKSYVMSEIGRSGQARIVNDSVTGEQFLVYSKAMSQSSGTTGIVVTARSIGYMDKLFVPIAAYTLAFDVIALIAIYLIVNKRLLGLLHYFTDLYEESKTNRPIPQSITFDKKESAVTIDGDVFKLPYSSNQYFLCDALFSAPHKRWEHQEIMGKFEDSGSPKRGDVTHWRKVYDAMLAINKKLGLRLIEGRDRTFYINPKMAGAIQKSRK